MPPKHHGKKGGSKGAARHVDADEMLLLERAILAAQAVKHRMNPEELAAKAKGGMTEAQLAQLEQQVERSGIQQRVRAMLSQQFHQAELERQRKAAEYKITHTFTPMENKGWFESAPGKWVRFEQFNPSTMDLQKIVDLMTASLSEPYNIFTYEHFIVEFPDLCICAFGVESNSKPSEEGVGGELIGCVSSKAALKKNQRLLRGYIAMLAVAPSFRGAKLGSRMVVETIEVLKRKGCFEAYLETPTHNERALKLYTDLGFIKTKFLNKYYIDKSDAVRLKLLLVTRKEAEKEAAAAASPPALESIEPAASA